MGINVVDGPKPQRFRPTNDLMCQLHSLGALGIRIRPDGGFQDVREHGIDRAHQAQHRVRGRGAGRYLHDRNTIGDHRQSPGPKEPFEGSPECNFV